MALWTDELFSVMTAEYSPRDILAITAVYEPGNFDHPPLYFLLLRSLLLIDHHPLLLRLPSILALMITVALWIRLIFHQTRSWLWALIGVTILMMHPMLWSQAVNVRMYALLALLGSGVILILPRLEQSKGQERAFYVALAGLLTALALYTSYFTLILAAGIFFWGAIHAFSAGFSRPPSARATSIFLSFTVLLIAAVVTVPWWDTLLDVVQSQGGGEPPQTTRAQQFKQWWLDFGGGWLGLIILVGGWINVVLNQQRRMWWEWLGAFFLLPTICLFLLVDEKTAVRSRYLIFAVPLLWTGAIVGYLSLWRRLVRFRFRTYCVGLMLVAPIPLFVAKAWHDFLKPVPDWWGVAEVLEQHVGQDEWIMKGGYLTGEALYYHMEHPERFQFIDGVVGLEEFNRLCADPRVIWYVNAAPLPEAFEFLARNYFRYRAQVPGNRGSTITVYSKKPFTLPWEAHRPIAGGF